MAEFVLHCFAQSGNAYKTALMLELGGADWTPRFVDFFNGETRTPAYRAINVMGEVPVLEHAGQRLSQSGVILDYLAGVLGKFDPSDDSERRDVLRWILFDNHKLTSYTATYRFMRMFVPNPDAAVLTCHDEYLLASMVQGVDGGLLGFASFIPELILELVNAVHAGDLKRAMDCQARINPLKDIVYGMGEPTGDAQQQIFHPPLRDRIESLRKLG